MNNNLLPVVVFLCMYPVGNILGEDTVNSSEIKDSGGVKQNIRFQYDDAEEANSGKFHLRIYTESGKFLFVHEFPSENERPSTFCFSSVFRVCDTYFEKGYSALFEMIRNKDGDAINLNLQNEPLDMLLPGLCYHSIRLVSAEIVMKATFKIIYLREETGGVLTIRSDYCGNLWWLNYKDKSGAIDRTLSHYPSSNMKGFSMMICPLFNNYSPGYTQNPDFE